jgi:hypothetical protein
VTAPRCNDGFAFLCKQGYIEVMSTTNATAAIDKAAIEAIQRVLKERLARIGFQDATIEAAPDHDGDPSLFIYARYKYSRKPIDPSATFGLTTKLRRALEAVGETRFPYVRHKFDERQRVATSS